jgi:hypothetical protein
MKLIATTGITLALALAGAGCGKKGGGGDDKSAASCAQAAASYVAIEQASRLPTVFTKLKPTPAQVAAVTALVQAHCETGKFEQYGNSLTDKPWSGKVRSCVAGAKPGEKMGEDPVADCFKAMGRGYGLHVAQIIDAFSKDEAAKAAAPPPPPPPPPPSAPSPGDGTGTGSAPPAPAPPAPAN